MLKACDEVHRHIKIRKCNVNMRWWNSGIKDEIQKKNVSYKEMTTNPTDGKKQNKKTNTGD